MKPFFVTTGTAFGLIAIAHMARIAAEPQMAGEPWFWLITIAAAALCVWAWRLFWISRSPRDSAK
jgi:hypothetical protein